MPLTTQRGGSHSTGASSFDPKAIQRSSTSELCDQCEEYGLERSYCNACDFSFCQRCWDQNLQHRKKKLAPGAVPHEKTDQSVARKIKRILDHKPSETEQEELHKHDEATGWFGILREEGELPLFQDYGRFARLLTETATLQARTPLSATSSGSRRDSRYPSLTSFVGQTGAGKSTVIKLMVDLQNMHDEDFATPVPGIVGKDDPTSDDVHLYLDPRSCVSEVPILYADCEGLEGGEREPLAARFRKKDKPMRGARVKSVERRIRDLQHTSEHELAWATTPVKRSREFAVTHLYPRLLYTFSDVVVFVLRNPR